MSDGAGKVIALDRSTLEVRWEKELGRSVYRVSPYRKDWVGLTSSPTLSGGLVYIGGGDGCLYALELASGAEVWQHAFGVPMLSTPLVTGDLLIVGSYDGHVYAFAGMKGSN